MEKHANANPAAARETRNTCIFGFQRRGCENSQLQAQPQPIPASTSNHPSVLMLLPPMVHGPLTFVERSPREVLLRYNVTYQYRSFDIYRSTRVPWLPYRSYVFCMEYDFPVQLQSKTICTIGYTRYKLYNNDCCTNL